MENKENVYQGMEQMATMWKSMMPTVKTSKNGYEIRTKVLEMAQSQMWQDFHAKYGLWETTIKREGDEVVTSVTVPEVPGVDKVLEAAEKMYAFVNHNK